MHAFLAELKKQRWDDHRYYHHSRINQTLHLVSALSFLSAYAFIFTNPVAAALIGWLVAMVSRQLGHFFFESKDYDEVNQATHAHKEDIKVGYNLRRKIVLLSIWGASPRCCGSIRHCSAFSAQRMDTPTSCAMSVRSGWSSAWARCCSARCSCVSAGRRRRAWCGSRRSSPTRFTTSYSTVERRCTCCAGELVDPMDDVPTRPEGSPA